MTKEAVIVATARTPIGRAYRGAFNDTDAPTLGGHVIAEAVRRAGIEPGEVDDVIMGCAMQQGTSGYNIGRTAAVAAGLPSSVSGMSIDRQCASGMMAICTAAKQVVNDNMPIVIGAGLDSISLVQNEHRNGFRAQSPSVTDKSKHAYMSMLETAEVVAKRYNISREQQDEFGLRSHLRAAAAQERGAFDKEIMAIEGHDEEGRKVLVKADTTVRGDTTLEGLASLRPAFDPKNGTVTAGTSSQIADGASAMIVMSGQRAMDLGLTPRAKIRSMAVAGVDPSIMGYGPVPSTQKALKRVGMSMDDIDTVELNEAFAAQALPVLKDLGLLDKMDDKVNLNGGAIALGHPFGCSGTRIITTLINVMEQQDTSIGLATMCIGMGQGISTIIERV